MGAPFLRRVVTLPEKVDPARYPFSVRAFRQGIDITFRTNVTFLVGENGSGKSTLLEALAECCGFNPEGGNRDHHPEILAERSELAQAPYGADPCTSSPTVSPFCLSSPIDSSRGFTSSMSRRPRSRRNGSFRF